MFNGLHDIFDYYEREFSSPIDETGSISYTIGNTLQTIKISQPKFLPQDIDLSSFSEKHRVAVVEDLRNI